MCVYRCTIPIIPGTDRHPSHSTFLSSLKAFHTGLIIIRIGCAIPSVLYRGCVAGISSITSCLSMPICGAARPTLPIPFVACLICSNTSCTKGISSGRLKGRDFSYNFELPNRKILGASWFCIG